MNTTIGSTEDTFKGVVGIVDRIQEQFREVTGYDVVNVASLRQVDDAWSGRVEVIELHRTPDTQDLVGLYEVELDGSGNLLAWERLSLRIKGAPVGLEGVAG
jgi:Gas vesicle synthesis protein GvpO